MKRADLAVGMRVYHSTDPNGRYESTRIVLATDPHKKDRWGRGPDLTVTVDGKTYRVPSTLVPADGGQGVLVTRGGDGYAADAELVQLRHLIEPVTPESEQARADRKAAAARREAERREQDERDAARRAALSDRLVALVGGYHSHSRSGFNLPTDQVERLVTLAEKGTDK